MPKTGGGCVWQLFAAFERLLSASWPEHTDTLTRCRALLLREGSCIRINTSAFGSTLHSDGHAAARSRSGLWGWICATQPRLALLHRLALADGAREASKPLGEHNCSGSRPAPRGASKLPQSSRERDLGGWVAVAGRKRWGWLWVGSCWGLLCASCSWSLHRPRPSSRARRWWP